MLAINDYRLIYYKPLQQNYVINIKIMFIYASSGSNQGSALAFACFNKRLKGQFIFDGGNTGTGAGVVRIAAGRSGNTDPANEGAGRQDLNAAA